MGDKLLHEIVVFNSFLTFLVENQVVQLGNTIRLVFVLFFLSQLFQGKIIKTVLVHVVEFREVLL